MVGKGPSGEIVFEAIWPNTWRRKSFCKYYMDLWHFGLTNKGDEILGRLSVLAPPDKGTNWSTLFSDLCLLMRPILARIHYFVGVDRIPYPSGSIRSRFWSGPGQREVTEGVTNLGWGNFFGEEMAKEVDADLIQSHGFPVEKIGDGYLLRVTEDIFDLKKNYAKFSQRRAELKSLFRPGMFQITDEPTLPG